MKLKIENVLPLSIWVIGLVISYVHIYRAASAHPALAEVAWAIPALFDLLVVYAAYVAIQRVRGDIHGWSASWPAIVAGIGLFASLWINTDYVQPRSASEFMLTWAAVIGSFFAYELWRALQGDRTDVAQAAVEQFKAEQLPALLARARSEARELDAAPGGGKPSTQRARKSTPQVAAASTDDQTQALLREFEAQGGDRFDQTSAIKFLRSKLDITYGPAHRRYKRVVVS